MKKSTKQQPLSYEKYFPAGGYAQKLLQQFVQRIIPCLFALGLTAPLERYRIIAQTQSTYPLRPKKFTSFLDYIQRVPKQQGFRSFWRGNNMASWIVLWQAFGQITIYDSMKGFTKQIFKQRTLQDSQIQKQLIDNLVLPSFAGFCSLAFLHPLDTYRIQRTMSYYHSPKDAPFTKFRHRLTQIGSVRNFYQGFWVANLITLANFHLYKNLFGLMQQNDYGIQIPNEFKQYTPLLFSLIAVALVHPLDTLKKMYQLNNLRKPAIFHNYRSVLKYLSQNKIKKGLFNGMLASLGRTLVFVPTFWGMSKVWLEFRQKFRQETRKF